MLAIVTCTLLLACQSRPASAPAGGYLEMALEVARRDHRKLDEASVRAELARWSAALAGRLANATDGNARAQALQTVLFDEARFQSVADLDSPETLHIDSVVRLRRGYCLSLSIVALALAESTGMPLFGVAAPNHFFVRYDDGHVKLNLELTRGGAIVPDDEYRDRMGGAWKPESVYLRNLRPEEVRAFLLHNRGYVAMQRKRTADAKSDLTEAARLLPALPEVHRNLGVLLGEARQWEPAAAAFTRALDLYPADADALVNRALCLRELGRLAEAVADLDAALLVDPGRERARALRAEWLDATRSSDWKSYQKAVVAPLDKPPLGLKPGIVGRYYSGTAFQKLAAERIDAALDFDWRNAAPVRGVPADRFSVRWEGWLKAPKDGNYSIFVIANDGVRLELDGRLWVDSWTDAGWQNYYGTADAWLASGWHRLQVEMYDQSGGARLLLRLGVEGEEKPLDLEKLLFHIPAAATAK